MITPSEPIGTPHIEDVVFKKRDQYKTLIVSVTPKGYLWLKENMEVHNLDPIVVDAEFEEELKDLMTKDGLTVIER